MPVSDLDITRSAHLWIQQHGEQATAKAREMVEEMRRRGNVEGADVWLRIIAAIGELGRRRLMRGTESAAIRHAVSRHPSGGTSAVER